MRFLGVLNETLINKVNSIPRPGDIVYAKNSDNCLVKDGTYGVIESAGARIVRAGWNITTPYFDKGVCTLSGGPVIGLKRKKVRPTFDKKVVTFWRFKGGYAMAHNGENFAGQVNVFEYDFKNN